MTIVTIPKKITKSGDLVILPRRDYEALIKRQRVVPVSKLTAKEKKAIERGRRELRNGEFITLEELSHELRSSRSKRR